MSTDPQRTTFDPTCTIWTTFAELRVGDRIDYWGPARPVLEHNALEHNRVRIVVGNGIGRDLALAPGAEGTWRATRDDEARTPDDTNQTIPDCERCDGSGLDPDAYYVDGDVWTHAPCSECQPADPADDNSGDGWFDSPQLDGIVD